MDVGSWAGFFWWAGFGENFSPMDLHSLIPQIYENPHINMQWLA